MSVFSSQLEMIEHIDTHRVEGRVVEVSGLTIGAVDLHVPVGAMCRVRTAGGGEMIGAVIGLRDEVSLVMPLEEPRGVARGDRVESLAGRPTVRVGPELLGRVIDGLGRPIDGGRALSCSVHYPLYAEAPAAMSRRPVDEPLGTGIRAIDGLLTVGKGQRLGLFSGTGVGKSVLLGMMARGTAADALVLALVGERGREVGDVLSKVLGEEGLRKAVVVVATSDQSPLLRVRASYVATAVAEYLRDQGQNVLLLMDSLTRMAMAQRQIGLSAGEPPTTKGYPPSTFAMLPLLLERAGRTQRGSITGFYTVLVEGDDLDEPISDAVRGVLDGHVVLSRAIAQRQHYPAIGVLESVSRVMPDVADAEHLAAAQRVLGLVSAYGEVEDLVNIGAYARGSNARFDLAIEMKPRIDGFLRQGMREVSSAAESRRGVIELAAEAERLEGQLRGRGVAGAAAARKEAAGRKQTV